MMVASQSRRQSMRACGHVDSEIAGHNNNDDDDDDDDDDNNNNNNDDNN